MVVPFVIELAFLVFPQQCQVSAMSKASCLDTQTFPVGLPVDLGAENSLGRKLEGMVARQ